MQDAQRFELLVVEGDGIPSRVEIPGATGDEHHARRYAHEYASAHEHMTIFVITQYADAPGSMDENHFHVNAIFTDDRYEGGIHITRLASMLLAMHRNHLR